jgi:hypothetical protein
MSYNLEPLRIEKATVYWGGGRRWFSKRQAARAEAKKLIRSKCICSGYESDTGYPGEVCKYHEMDAGRWSKLRNKLANKILIQWNRK